MALIVQKYGGTSVGDPDRIANVANRVIKGWNQGNKMVVVLSAMSGETDRLIKLGKELADYPDPREMDVLMATGEQVTVSLFSIYLKSQGIPATSLLSHQAHIYTDRSYGRARIVAASSSTCWTTALSGRTAALWCCCPVSGHSGPTRSNGSCRPTNTKPRRCPSIFSAAGVT